jgi:NDP-sugar pyrophosphorylase family protein
VDAVVMAAGEGTRLRPLTSRWPKPVLPIDGRPVVATLLHELRVAGCRRAWVVVGHLGEQVAALLGDGTGFGLALRYVAQPHADGSADAVGRARAAGAEPPLLVAAADTVFRPGDPAAFAARAAGEDGAIAFRRDPRPDPPHRAALGVRGDRVVRMIDEDPSNPRASAPLWWIGPRLAPSLEEPLPGPPYGLACVFQRAIDRGVEIRAIEIGKTRDLTYPVDLVEENFPYLQIVSRGP